MSIQYHTAHANKAFDQLIERVEAWLENKANACGPFDKRIVRERLAQSIVAASRGAFNALCARRLAQGKDLIPPDDEVLDIGGLLIDPKDGRVRIGYRLFVRSIAALAYVWLRLLLSIALPRAHERDWKQRPATLLFGLGTKGAFFRDSDERFIHFCRKGPIAPLRDAKRVLIQDWDRKGSVSSTGFVYSRDPVAELVRDSRLGVRARVSLLLEHLWKPMAFLWETVRLPLMALLGRDLVAASAVLGLDRAGLLESVVITNSNYTVQELWMRGPATKKFKVHKVHYSQNSIGFQYIDCPMAAVHPAFRHVRVDEHWVWTPGYKEHLVRLGHQGPIHVVGPIIWYLPELPVSRSNGEIRIVVFDVTPFYAHKAEGMGVIRYYYKVENMIQFINDILTSSKELERDLDSRFRVILKHKRAFTEGFHDRGYIDHIQGLLKTQERFELAPYDVNIFSLLGSCDLCVCIPYTSPAYIANHLRKPAIYFDPTEELRPTHEATPFVHFASGRAELMTRIKMYMGEIDDIRLCGLSR